MEERQVAVIKTILFMSLVFERYFLYEWTLMKEKIDIPRDKLGEFCRRHHIRKLGLFGSVLRDDFGPDSDVDVLVEFDADCSVGLFKMVELEQELSELFGRKVDLVERRSVERSDNYIRRRHVLESVETVYVA